MEYPFSALMCLTRHHVSSLQSTSIWYSDDIYNGRMPILYKMSYYYRFISRRLQVLSWSNDVTKSIDLYSLILFQIYRVEPRLVNQVSE